MVTESMEERLGKLERATRRYRLVLVGMGTVILIVVAFWVVVGTVTPAQALKPMEAGSAIRATSISLVDGDGVVRAALTMGNNGPQLLLYDDRARIRVLLHVPEDGPSLCLYDEGGEPAVFLSSDTTGQMLSMSRRSGEDCVLSVNGSGPALVMRGNGSYGALLAAKGGEPCLRLYDAGGDAVWSTP